MPKLLFSYEGQIGIKQFWLGLLGGLATTVVLATLVGLVLGIALAVSGATAETHALSIYGGSFLVVGYAIYTQLAVMLKRCKDRGRSGWWCLLSLVPFVGLVWVIFDLGLQRGATDNTAA